MLPKKHAWESFERGPAYEPGIALNPFQFSVIGSTDDPVRFEEAITGRFTPDDSRDHVVHADGLTEDEVGTKSAALGFSNWADPGHSALIQCL